MTEPQKAERGALRELAKNHGLFNPLYSGDKSGILTDTEHVLAFGQAAFEAGRSAGLEQAALYVFDHDNLGNIAANEIRALKEHS